MSVWSTRKGSGEGPVSKAAATPMVKTGWMVSGNAGSDALLKKHVSMSKRTYLPEVFLPKAGNFVVVRLLDEEPVSTIIEHSIRNGKRFMPYTCLAGNVNDAMRRNTICPLCNAGEERTGWRSFRALYNAIDRSEYVDKKGIKHQNVLKVLKVNISLYQQLRDLSDADGLMGRDLRLKRLADGKSWSVTPLSPTPLTAKEKGMQRHDIPVLYAPKSVDYLNSILGVSEGEGDEDSMTTEE